MKTSSEKKSCPQLAITECDGTFVKMELTRERRSELLSPLSVAFLIRNWVLELCFGWVFTHKEIPTAI